MTGPLHGQHCGSRQQEQQQQQQHISPQSLGRRVVSEAEVVSIIRTKKIQNSHRAPVSLKQDAMFHLQLQKCVLLMGELVRGRQAEQRNPPAPRLYFGPGEQRPPEDQGGI